MVDSPQTPSCATCLGVQVTAKVRAILRARSGDTRRFMVAGMRKPPIGHAKTMEIPARPLGLTYLSATLRLVLCAVAASFSRLPSVCQGGPAVLAIL